MKPATQKRLTTWAIRVCVYALCFFMGYIAMAVYTHAQPDDEEPRECHNQYGRVVECP